MNYIKYLFILCFVNSEKIIKNIKINTIKDINYPSCYNCFYYKPSPFSTDYGSSTSKCEKIGEKNILNGHIKYDYVSLCRMDESKCGKEGKYFEEQRNLNLKMFIHMIISSFPNTILISVIVFYLLLKKSF